MKPSRMERIRRDGLGTADVVLAVAAVLLACTLLIVGSQWLVDRQPLVVTVGEGSLPAKEQVELAKLAAEVRQMRSETSGGPFWLKLVALFVTVGGAIGGYLVGQERATRARRRLEDRRTIDTLFQTIVQELASPQALLRAAAAVKLGEIVHQFPHDWQVAAERRTELVALAKRVLAAALALEADPKVLKTLTIALARHPGTPGPDGRARWDLTGLDLSGVHADDAYWARCDLTYSDLYRASMRKASLRNAVLVSAQCREACLADAVLAGADAAKAVFKLADLRGADLRGARLEGADFEGARVHGALFDAAGLAAARDAQVDVSPQGDGSAMVRLQEVPPSP